MQMVKLTAENIHVKLGKRVNIATLTEAAVTNAQIDDVGSFSKFTSLVSLDLSKNRFAYPRQLEGLKHAPALKSLVLAGCPLSMRSGYRKLVFDALPNLEVLDSIPKESDSGNENEHCQSAPTEQEVSKEEKRMDNNEEKERKEKERIAKENEAKEREITQRLEEQRKQEEEKQRQAAIEYEKELQREKERREKELQRIEALKREEEKKRREEEQREAAAVEQAKREEAMRKQKAEEARQREQQEYEKKKLEQEQAKAAEAEIERLRLRLKRQELAAKHTAGAAVANGVNELEKDDLFQSRKSKKPLSLFNDKAENDLLSFADEEDLAFAEKEHVAPRKTTQQKKVVTERPKAVPLAEPKTNENNGRLDPAEKDFDFAAYINREKASASQQKKVDIFGDDVDIF